MQLEKSPFSTDYFINYYNSYRNKAKDLFDSERKFFSEIMTPNKNFLDVGCAVGGMYEIINNMEPTIKYVGIDISSEMIKQAKKNYPDVDFRVSDGNKLPFNEEQFDRVITLGTTVHNPNYQSLLMESYRVCKELLFFDIRIIPDLPSLVGVDQSYVLDGAEIKYPYVVVNWDELKAFFMNLNPMPALVKGYGYWGKANEFTTLPNEYKKICMATFILYREKNADLLSDHLKMESNLPFKI